MPITAKSKFYLNGVAIQPKRFPNGETYIPPQELETALSRLDECRDANHDVLHALEWRFEGNADFFELMMIREILKERRPFDTIGLYIYYMPYARMDRQMAGMACTLKTAAQFINSLNFAVVHVLDAHSDTTRVLLDRSTELISPASAQENTTALELFHSDALTHAQFDETTDVVLYPDFGAQKRAKKAYQNQLVAMKKRELASGHITAFEIFGTIPENGRIFIVDDMCSYGNTFINIAKSLMEKGVEKERIILVVTHAEQGLALGDVFDYFDTVYTTNSFYNDSTLDEVVKAKTENKLKLYNIYPALESSRYENTK